MKFSQKRNTGSRRAGITERMMCMRLAIERTFTLKSSTISTRLVRYIWSVSMGRSARLSSAFRMRRPMPQVPSSFRPGSPIWCSHQEKRGVEG